jgi:hypothetical protein
MISRSASGSQRAVAVMSTTIGIVDSDPIHVMTR